MPKHITASRSFDAGHSSRLVFWHRCDIPSIARAWKDPVNICYSSSYEHMLCESVRPIANGTTPPLALREDGCRGADWFDIISDESTYAESPKNVVTPVNTKSVNW
jgi:hypothetical protein